MLEVGIASNQYPELHVSAHTIRFTLCSFNIDLGLRRRPDIDTTIFIILGISPQTIRTLLPIRDPTLFIIGQVHIKCLLL